MLNIDRHTKVFTLTSSSHLQLRGQRSKIEIVSNNKSNKVNLLIMDRQTKVSTVTLWFDLPLNVKGHAKCYNISHSPNARTHK